MTKTFHLSIPSFIITFVLCRVPVHPWLALLMVGLAAITFTYKSW